MVAHKGGETPCDRLVDIEARLEDSVGHVYVIVHGSAFDDIDSQAAVDDVAATVAADEQEEATLGSKVIVIHPGSQNLRIGLANDVLPKSLPNVTARTSPKAEFEEEETSPKRMKVMDDDGEEVEEPEALFGEEISVTADFYINRAAGNLV